MMNKWFNADMEARISLWVKSKEGKSFLDKLQYNADKTVSMLQESQDYSKILNIPKWIKPKWNR